MTWPRDPIDRFVLARIEAAKPEATARCRAGEARLGGSITISSVCRRRNGDRRVRGRLSARGARQSSSLVDRLLASPQFGERWGRHWLDVARYRRIERQRRPEPQPDVSHMPGAIATT